MRILGIDPGLTGGIALLVVDGIPFCWGAIDIPTIGEDAKRRVDAVALHEWMTAAAPEIAFIERAQAMPDQGSSSGFIYGRATGALETIAALFAPVHLVEAQTWKRNFRLPGSAKIGSNAAKEYARQAALRVMPSAQPLMMRKKDHGRAEALLIAMWGADQIEMGKINHAGAGFFRSEGQQRSLFVG